MGSFHREILDNTHCSMRLTCLGIKIKITCTLKCSIRVYQDLTIMTNSIVSTSQEMYRLQVHLQHQNGGASTLLAHPKMYVNGSLKELTTAYSNYFHQHNTLLSFLCICSFILTIFKILCPSIKRILYTHKNTFSVNKYKIFKNINTYEKRIPRT